ncbi:MAG: sulfite exporter TauE/SafE family protein [Actinomycetes bacterium]
MVGLLVGAFNALAGGAAVVSFPILVATGINPVSAAMTNSLGIYSANITALLSNKSDVKSLLRIHKKFVSLILIGTVVGAIGLSLLPEKNFEKLTPFLMLLATYSLTPKAREKFIRIHRHFETVLMIAVGLYGGYFGPGVGVMVIAMLAKDVRTTPATINGAKNMVTSLTGLVSNSIFIASGKIVWSVAGALFVGASIGGYLGGHLVHRFRAETYRAFVFVIGISSSIWMFYKYVLH